AYTPATNRWTAVAPLSTGRRSLAATVGPDGRIYAVGGETGNGFAPTTSVEVYGPVVTANPSSAAPGTSVTVTGNNFAASAAVSVYLGPSTGTLLKTGTTSSTGALAPITFTVPNVPSGDSVLTVVDDRSQYPITLFFRVN